MRRDEGHARLGDEARQTGNGADARRLVATGRSKAISSNLLCRLEMPMGTQNPKLDRFLSH
jgi:hypothetical protein